MRNSITREFKGIFHLALPLIFNLLAYMAMQVISTVMLGRLGPQALAAAAVGNVIYIIILVGCMGVLTAVGTLAAEAFGKKDQMKVQTISQQGIWLAIFLSIPALLVVWNAHHILLAIHQPVEVVRGAKSLLHGLFWGFLPELCFIGLREFSTAISRPKIVMFISVGTIPVNIMLNYWFIYGGLGLPAMKIFGVGLATSIVCWLSFLVLALYLSLHRNIYHYKILQFTLPHWNTLKRIVKLGLPVGTSFVVEELLFVIVALLIGYFGVVALAAHQIAIQCMYLFVMIPIGIAQAVAVKVSQARADPTRVSAFRVAYIAIGSGLGLAFITACLFWFFPKFFVHFFLNVHIAQNQPVLQLAVKLLAITAIFHIIDAGQLITNGALRGFQDTLVPMFLGLISFWLMGIGSGYVFGFIYHYGAVGLWWGLALGIASSAILLQLRLQTHK
ncbi:MAG: MATE family efflux transporter [Gammaproteobacteria bacterium]|nr:MATE family efflux transporter [Gammaproteobacteria bacterium]